MAKYYFISPCLRVCIICCALIFGFGCRPGISADLCMDACPQNSAPAGSIAMDSAGRASVRIVDQDGVYTLYRNGHPYFIKGVGGDGHLAKAAAAGANSVRTWDSQNAGDILAQAARLEMTVLIGVWLSHKACDYADSDYRQSKVDEVQMLLNRYKDHPALLMWSLGNEINLEGADTPQAWQFVNDLAGMIKSQDSRHPVITVMAYNPHTLGNISRHAPAIDAIGINAYGALPAVREMLQKSSSNKPYLVTEWGTYGHWEAGLTSWGRPIEPTSAAKAEHYRHHYVKHILANSDRCLGSYVFLWGQKQERTPTWYSLFIDHLPGIDTQGLASSAVDVMRLHWSGGRTENLAPDVTAMTINGGSSDQDIKVAPGGPVAARVLAYDPENDPLYYYWELLEEPTRLGSGGSYEPRPPAWGNVVQGSVPVFDIEAPDKTGEYRLFVYVLDENGHVGTANIPFFVESYQVQESDTQSERPAAG